MSLKLREFDSGFKAVKTCKCGDRRIKCTCNETGSHLDDHCGICGKYFKEPLIGAYIMEEEEAELKRKVVESKLWPSRKETHKKQAALA